MCKIIISYIQMDKVYKELQTWKEDVHKRTEDLAKELLQIEHILKKYERRSVRREQRYIKKIAKSRLDFY